MTSTVVVGGFFGDEGKGKIISYLAIKDNPKILNYIHTPNVNWAMINTKIINKNSKKLKILGSGEVKDKINIEADLASKSAIEKLEKIGGSIQLKK